MPDALTNINQAINAYKTAKGNSDDNQGKDPSAGEEFSSLVKNAIDEAIKIGKKGERFVFVQVDRLFCKCPIDDLVGR